MIILGVLIFCNVLLGIIFKYFAKYNVDNLHAIIFNYITSVAVAGLVLGTSPIPEGLFSKPWLWVSLLLGILFITGFNIMALSFQKAGVVLTSIVAKMSLVISAGFAIAYYNELLNLPKGIGIFAALGAIILVNFPSKTENLNLSNNKYIWLPIITMIMSGIIEILLLVVGQEGLLGDDGIIFTSTSFAFAGFFGLLYAIYRMLTKGNRIAKQDVIGGILLGVPNFFTIYLLVYLLNNGWDGSVLFPINSIGMLVFSVIAGVIMFSEKMNIPKGIGLALSILAILLISAS